MNAYLLSLTRNSLVGATAILMALGLTSCPGGMEVLRPSNDSTASTIKLVANWPFHDTRTLVPGGFPGQTNTAGSDVGEITLTATAEDPQGVKNVIITADGSAACGNSNVTQNKPFGYETMNPDPGGTYALTKRTTILFYDPDHRTSCQAGISYIGTSAVFTAKTINFSDTETTTATYTVTHKP
jgi:hypothetical protein